jgi:hypothetical protein
VQISNSGSAQSATRETEGSNPLLPVAFVQILKSVNTLPRCDALDITWAKGDRGISYAAIRVSFSRMRRDRTLYTFKAVHQGRHRAKWLLLKPNRSPCSGQVEMTPCLNSFSCIKSDRKRSMQIPARFEMSRKRMGVILFQAVERTSEPWSPEVEIRCTDAIKHQKHLALWFYDLTTTAGLLLARPSLLKILLVSTNKRTREIADLLRACLTGTCWCPQVPLKLESEACSILSPSRKAPP